MTSEVSQIKAKAVHRSSLVFWSCLVIRQGKNRRPGICIYFATRGGLMYAECHGGFRWPMISPSIAVPSIFKTAGKCLSVCVKRLRTQKLSNASANPFNVRRRLTGKEGAGLKTGSLPALLGEAGILTATSWELSQAPGKRRRGMTQLLCRMHRRTRTDKLPCVCSIPHQLPFVGVVQETTNDVHWATARQTLAKTILENECHL